MHRIRWGMPLLVMAVVGAAASTWAAPLGYVADHGDDDVVIVDAATNQTKGTIPVGHRPLGVAVDPEGAHVYVSNQDGTNGSVSIIDVASKEVIDVAVGNDPTGVALKLPGTVLYVANRVDRTVSVIDTATNQIIGSPTVGDNPLGVAVDPAGTRVYVVNKGSGTVSVIDTGTNQVVRTIDVGTNPTHVAVSPAGDRAYVTNNGLSSVSVINTTTLNVTGTIDVGGFPEGVAFSPDGARAYVANKGTGTLSVIDTALHAVITTVTVGEDASDVSVAPDGSRVYVLNRGEKTISVVDTASNSEIDVDGNTSNGVTRIPVGIGPVALGNVFAPAPRPPRFDKLGLVCQAAIAANGRAFAKIDQVQRTTCQRRILADVAGGKETQQDEATCALALDPGIPISTLARARSSARAAIQKKCSGVDVAAIEGPCQRDATSFATVSTCVLDQHQLRVAEMVADTFSADDSKVLSKAALACESTIAKGAARFALAEQTQLGGCLLRILKNAAKRRDLLVSAAACARSLDSHDPSATLPKLRASIMGQIAKKCVGLVPADLGGPCDPAATTIDQVATCVLANQAKRVEKMIAAEFNSACPMLTTVGLARAYPDVCTGH